MEKHWKRLKSQNSTVVKTKNAFAWEINTGKGKGVFGYVEEENRLSPEIDTTWKNIGTMKYGERQQMELRSRESLLVLQEINLLPTRMQPSKSAAAVRLILY